MIIAKITKQKWDLLKKTHPDLYATINVHTPKLSVELSEDDKGILAGLIIEYVLKSNGYINIFQDDFARRIESIEDDFLIDNFD